MTTRSRNLAIVLSTLVLAGAATFIAARRAPRAHREIIDGIPSDSFVAITVDMSALRGSVLGAKLLAGAKATLRPVERLSASCGWDVLSRVTQLAIAVPEGNESGDLGILARADVTREELQSCATKVLAERGEVGSTERDGPFYLLGSAQSGSGPSERPKIALREDGFVLVARGAWLRAMLDAAQDRRKSMRESADHASLRSKLGADGPDHPTVIATMLLPAAMRERVQAQMTAEAEQPDADPNGKATMAALLGVASAGVSLMAGDESTPTRAMAVLRCETVAGCDAVRDVILRKRQGWARDLRYRAVGLGRLVDSLEAIREGPALTITVSSPTRSLVEALDYALESGEAPRPPRAPAGALPAPVPDETLPARERTADGG